MVDALRSRRSDLGRGGSSPSPGTKLQKGKSWIQLKKQGLKTG